MIISFRDKLLTKELRHFRLLNVATAVFVTVLGFIFEFAFHDGYILVIGLMVAMLLTSNYFFSYYSDFYRKNLITISHASIILLHMWAAYVAYVRDFEIDILLPVAISTFTFSLLFDKFYKSLAFVFIVSAFLLFLMVIKDEWKPEYTITLIALFSGAFVSEEIMKRKAEYHDEITGQEKRYLSLVENMNDGLIFFHSGKISLVNDRFCGITGSKKEDLAGMSYEDFSSAFHGEQDIREAIADLIASGRSFVRQSVLKGIDGRKVNVQLRAAAADGTEALLVYTDISDLNSIQERLKKSEEGYRTFIDQSAVGIWRAEYREPIATNLPVEKQIELLLDTGIISECNEFMAKMYGHASSDELIGKKIRDFYLIENNFDEQKTRQLMETFILNQYRLVNTESKEQDKNGNTRYILNNNIGIVENGMLVRTWGVQTDITERKRTERELMETNQELDTFFYKASHDLKGPLASVMGIVNLARVENTDKVNLPYFDLIEKSVKRLDRTLMDLIELARTRKGTSKKTSIHFRSLIDQIVTSLQHLTGFERINFIYDIEDDLRIMADQVLMLSVFQNLIHNAINYSTVRDPFVRISAYRKGENYEFVVADNGTGIPDKIKDKVFGMFYRGNPDSSGSGLGLFIVKNALEKMNGTIRFESKEKNGSSFFVTIPVNLNDE